MNFTITQEVLERLENIQKDMKLKDATEVLKCALAVYDFLVTKEAVAIVTKNNETIPLPLTPKD